MTVTDKIDQFFAQYPQQRYLNGDFLVRAEESPAGIFYLKIGQVRQFFLTSAGEEVVVNIFKPPAYLPMSWAINKTPNDYYFQVTSPAKIHLAPADEVLKFVKTNPEILFDLLSRVYRGTDGLQRRFRQLMAGSAQARLVTELTIAGRRFGRPDRRSGKVSINLTERDLATQTGLSRETVSREISKLKRAGLVALFRHSIEVALPQLEDAYVASV